MRLRPAKIDHEQARAVAEAREALNAALGKPTPVGTRDRLYADYADALEAAGLPQPPDWRDWPADTTRRPPADRPDTEEGR